MIRTIALRILSNFFVEECSARLGSGASFALRAAACAEKTAVCVWRTMYHWLIVGLIFLAAVCGGAVDHDVSLYCAHINETVRGSAPEGVFLSF